MEPDNNIKIITIKPNRYRGQISLAALTAAHISQIKAEDLTVLDVRANENDGTIEILAEKIREFELHVLPAPVIKKPDSRRDKSKMQENYNRMQNTKYNMAKRNYKGRNR